MAYKASQDKPDDLSEFSVTVLEELRNHWETVLRRGGLETNLKLLYIRKLENILAEIEKRQETESCKNSTLKQ